VLNADNVEQVSVTFYTNTRHDSGHQSDVKSACPVIDELFFFFTDVSRVVNRASKKRSGLCATLHELGDDTSLTVFSECSTLFKKKDASLEGKYH
jgi:hypothetical protein